MREGCGEVSQYAQNCAEGRGKWLPVGEVNPTRKRAVSLTQAVADFSADEVEEEEEDEESADDEEAGMGARDEIEVS